MVHVDCLYGVDCMAGGGGSNRAVGTGDAIKLFQVIILLETFD